jgi:hypothetical protein
MAFLENGTGETMKKIAIFLVMALMFICIIYSTIANELVSYYPADETDGDLVDIVGGHNLNNYYSVGSGSGFVNGSRGGNFSDTNYFYTNNAITFNETNDLTLEFWYKPIDNILQTSILSTQNDGGNNFVLTALQDGAGIVFRMGGSGVGVVDAGLWYATNGSGEYLMQPDEWVYLTMTYNNYSMCVYANGMNKTCILNTYTGTTPTNIFAVGVLLSGNASGGGGLSSQYIDEIKIYDYAMSESEVLTSYEEYVPELNCTPDWICSGYGACNSSDLQPCNAVTDLNTCGESYTGDYSEFTPQACDFCTPDWHCSGYDLCVKPMASADCNAVDDYHDCGESYTGDYSEFDPYVCSYPSTGTSETSAVSRGDIMYCTTSSDGSKHCSATPPKTSSWESTTFSGVPLQTNGVWEKFIAWLKGIFGEWN